MSNGTAATGSQPPRQPGSSKVETEAIQGDAAGPRRVRWIEWDSGFRGSGLKVSDRIVGDLGERYTAETDKSGAAFGAAGEWQRWERFGLGAGDPVTILVERKGELLTLEGRLVEQRLYRSADGVPILGDGGPITHEKDGFDYAWNAWYNNFRKLAETVLAGWDYTVAYDTRKLRQEIEPFRERVEFLERTYPGPFARAVREDFEAMLETIAGEKREIAEHDLEYRRLGELRAAQVSQAADAAYQAFLAEVAGDLIAEPFPAPDPFREDTRDWIGKVVKLPEIGDRDLLLEVKRSWYQVRGSQGVYLIDRHAEAIRPLYAAVNKYTEQVNPYLRQRRFAFIGLIEPLPALVSDATRNVTVVGLRLRPVGALVGDAENPANRFFVDLRPEQSGESAFAGQPELLSIGRPDLSPDLGPAGVLQVFFECLKLADFETWRQCFATWSVRSWYERDSSYLYVDLAWTTVNERDASTLWDQSRRRLLDDVYAVEVAGVSPARIVYDAAAQSAGRAGAGAGPRLVEEVRILVNHVGRFGDEYRTFAGYNLHRKWTLERLDDGPWRITSPQAI
ncbi:MAG: hypothetical protein L0332_32440 [Chloroflexi bacterium]|nr:hypothetical protein [Chloroflexota bacterium]MCI0576907.1 hypothetical protein [Chloroflexota bacterium]MCI0646439.1 hypothetical protein [Chloroflexota bacterium]MCI0731413.1 hypothetical protein [Chloroflexota bacterium]